MEFGVNLAMIDPMDCAQSGDWGHCKSAGTFAFDNVGLLKTSDVTLP